MSNTSYGSYTVTNISSITDITNYYLATSASSGVDINNPNWSTDPTTQVMDETKQYLWTYEKTFLGDGSVLNTTTPIIIGRYGKDGGTGKGISSIVEWYQTSANNVTAPATPTAAGTGYSSSPVATTTDKPYLWNYEVVNYTSGNPYVSDARVIGTHGQNGNSVTVSSVKYATSTTDSQPADSSFTYTSVPTVAEGNWLWSLTTYSDGKKVYSKAKQGKQGVSVTNVTSTNNTADGGTSVVTVTLSDGTTKTFNVKNGNTGNTAQWYYGTELTHTSGTATLATSSTSGVVVGAMYLNTQTSLCYKCTAISGSNATWTYAGDLTTGVLDNIEIGGRNYARNTGTFSDIYMSVPTKTSILAEGGEFFIRTSPTEVTWQNLAFIPFREMSLFEGKTVTVSCEVRTTGTVSSQSNAFYITLDAYPSSTRTTSRAGNYDIPFNLDKLKQNEWVKVSATVVINTSSWNVQSGRSRDEFNYLGIGLYNHTAQTIDFRHVKFEYGNKATDWTPAPEDLQVQSVWYAECSTAAATTAKVATIIPATTAFSLQPGATVNVKFSYTNSGAVGSLTLNVNNTGAKSIKYLNNNSIANIAGAGYIVANAMYQFRYDGTYWIMEANYNSNTVGSYGSGALVAGTNKIYDYALVMRVGTNTWESFTMSAGTATTKAKNPSGFYYDKILYVNARYNTSGTGYASGTSTSAEVYAYLSLDLRYSTNCGQTLTTGKPVYIVGVVNNGLFYLDDTWWTQTEPTTEDGKTYIYIGNAYSNYQVRFNGGASQIYQFKGGAFRTLADNAMTTANGKNAVFHQASAPSSTTNTLKVGDTWFDTDDGFKMYNWDGDSWEPEQYGTNAIADVAITSAKIGNLAVTNAKIANSTIESGKIANLDVGKLTGGYIDASHLTADNIRAGTLTADRIAVGSIEYIKLSNAAKQEIKDSLENMLFDVYVPSLTAVDGPSDRYLSDATNSQTTGEFIAEDNLPDSKSTHFYRITYGNGARGLSWYVSNYVPFQNGEKYRIGCYARGTGTAKISPRIGAYGYNLIGYSVTSEWKWYEIIVDFRDTGSTNDTYKRVYYYITGASGNTLDMCGWKVTRLSDYQGNGDNLLLESNVQKSNSSYNIGSYYFGGDKPKHGDVVTLTLKGSLGENKTGWGIYNSGGQVGCFEVGYPLSNLWYDSSDGTYKATFIWKEYNPTGTQVANNTYLNIYTAPSTVTGVTSTIDWIKLERGSIATPWCLNSIERTNGGRNLLLGTKDFSTESGNNQTGITKTTDTYQGLNILKGVWSSGNMDMGRFENKFSVALEPNTDYTLSFWAKADTAMTAVSYLFTPSTIVSGYNSSGNTTTSTDGAISTNITTAWKRHWVTWHTSTATSQATSLIAARRGAAGTIYIAGVKFEKGTTPTDWTPAPEDVDNAIENITVSGRNLLKDSEKIGSSWTIQNGTNSNGTVTLTRTTAETRIYQMPANGYWTWEPSTEYVASIEAKGNAGGELLQFACNGGGTVTYNNTNPTITTSWKRYSMSFVTGTSVSTGSMSFLNGTNNSTIQVRKPKLEKGNKATDWSPAPEDTSEAIEKAQSSADGKTTNFYNTEDNEPDGIKVGDTWFVQGHLNLYEEFNKLNYPYTNEDMTLVKNLDGSYTLSGTTSSSARWLALNISTNESGLSAYNGKKYLSNGTYLLDLGLGASGIRIGVTQYNTIGSNEGASAKVANATSGRLSITIDDTYAYNSITLYVNANTAPNATFTPTIYRTSDPYTTIEVKQWDGDSWEPTTYGDECFSRIDAGTITTGELRTIQLKGPNEDTYWDLSTGEWQSHGVREDVEYTVYNTQTEQNETGTWDIETDVNIDDGLYRLIGKHDNKESEYVTFGVQSGKGTSSDNTSYIDADYDPYAFAGLQLRGDRINGRVSVYGENDTTPTDTPCTYIPMGQVQPDYIELGGSEGVRYSGQTEEEAEANYASGTYEVNRNRLLLTAGESVRPQDSIEFIEYYRWEEEAIAPGTYDYTRKINTPMYRVYKPIWEVMPGDVITISKMCVAAWLTGNSSTSNQSTFHVFIPFSRPISQYVVSFEIEGTAHTCYRASGGTATWTASGAKSIQMSGGDIYAQVESISENGIQVWLRRTVGTNYSNATDYGLHNLELTDLVLTALDYDPYDNE